MNPSEIKFTAEEGKRKGCRGCLFEPEHSSVCHAACAEAKRRGLPDCDSTGPTGKSVIYVLVPVDERQQDLFNEQGI